MLDLLIKLGLSDKEASVYLAVLELGKSSVQNIAKKSGVKRVTTYVILDQLVKLGVMTVETENKKSLYRAEHPGRLEKILDIRASELQMQRAYLKGNMNQLEALYSFNHDKPTTVQLFEGREGLEALEAYGHDQMIIGSEVMTITPQDLAENVLSKRGKEIESNRIARGILSRAIYVADKEISAEKNNKELRVGIHLSRKELPLNGSFFIYPGWGMKFLSYTKKKEFGILVQSAELADALKEVFELAWDGAMVKKIRRK